MNGIACLAMTCRLSSSFRKNIWPRVNMIVLTSSIVLSSSFGDARVMKQMNRSLAEQTDVIGFPLFFSSVTADLIVFTNSWIVVTKIGDQWDYENCSENDETHNLSSQGRSAESWWLRCQSTCSCPHRWSSGSVFGSLDYPFYRFFDELTIKFGLST